MQLPVRSLVGLIPLYAVLTLEPELINKFPSFKRRLQWFVDNRNDVAERNIASLKSRGKEDRLLLSLVNKDRLVQILKRMLDETEFLSEHGIRSLSKYHRDHPYAMEVNGQEFKVGYVPGDSDSGLFGGNSNWRGNVRPVHYELCPNEPQGPSGLLSIRCLSNPCNGSTCFMETLCKWNVPLVLATTCILVT